MNRYLRALMLFLAIALSLRARAQENQPREPVEGTVEEAGPITYYLKDEKGNLVPVPGFSYEHYRDLVLQAVRSGTEPPAYTLEKLSLTGTTTGSVVRLEAEFVIHVRKPGWVTVPLRLQRAALRDTIVSTSGSPSVPAMELIHRYDAKEGHVVWLGGAKERQHTFRVPLVTRLVQAGREQQLTLSLPKASEARLVLDIPQAIEDAAIKAGDGLSETTNRDGKSQIAVTGAGGELTLAWRAKQTESAQVLNLDVSSEIAVNVDTRDAIGLSARLHVARADEPVRRIFVRLPPHTEFLPRPGTKDFVAAVATAEEVAAGGFDAERLAGDVVVRVDFERAAESIDCTIEAGYKPEARGKRPPVELGGYEVLGAGRQVGLVSIHLPSGWSLKATPNAFAFRTDDLPQLSGQARANARYRFVRQPFSLQIDLVPQSPRTIVEPTFFAMIQAQRVTLTAKLDYQVRGPQPELLEIDLGEWKLDEVGPDNLAEIEDQIAGKPAHLRLQPESGAEFTLELQLHRDVPADSVELGFGLPRAIATQILPATLAVAATDNIALTPQIDDIRALSPESRPPQLPASFGSRPLVYRELPATAEAARFVTGFQVRKRRVTTTIDGRAQIAAQRADVEQKVSLQVAYEPLSSVRFEAPAEVPLADLRITQGDQLLSMSEEALSVAANATIRRWRVELLEPATGSVELIVRYALAAPKGDGLVLPLVTPVEEEGVVTARQQLSIESRDQRQLVLGENDAADPGLSSTSTPQGMTLVWPRRATQVHLARSDLGTAGGPALRVERQWLQSWFTPSARRDRYVAHVVGATDQIGVVLPLGAVAADLEVHLDGRLHRAWIVRNQTLVVSLAAAADRHHTLEVWYLLPGSVPSSGPQRRSIELPRIERAGTPQQSWLQVLTPSSEQILYSRSAVTPEQAWRKQGWSWQPAGVLTTHELETLLGASHDAVGPVQFNDALFMTLGSLPSLEVVVWGRRWLWTCTAAVVLTAGILTSLLSRRKSLLLMGALVLTGIVFALVSPQLALNVGQYAGAGLLLFVALAWSLRVTGARTETPAPSVSPVRRSDSRVSQRDSSFALRSASLSQSAAEEARL